MGPVLMIRAALSCLSLGAFTAVAVSCAGLRTELGGLEDGGVETQDSDGGTLTVPMADGGMWVPDASLPVTVVEVITGRSRLGARSTVGYGGWHGGLAVR